MPDNPIFHSTITPASGGEAIPRARIQRCGKLAWAHEVVVMIVTLAVHPSGTEAAHALVERWAAPEDAGRNQPSRLARALLRAVLAERSGHADWSLAADPRGKPLAVGGIPLLRPAVSLSHTRGWVAAAVADGGDLGIDVERHAERDFRALAAHAFGPAEQAEVKAGGGASFYRLWTLREAMGKATGAGLSLAADGRDYVARGLPQGCWRNGDWQFASLLLEAGYSLAIALHSADPAPLILQCSAVSAVTLGGRG